MDKERRNEPKIRPAQWTARIACWVQSRRFIEYYTARCYTPNRFGYASNRDSSGVRFGHASYGSSCGNCFGHASHRSSCGNCFGSVSYRSSSGTYPIQT